MAAKVSDEQRQQVRTALSKAGANEETVGGFKDGDLDVLFSNGWDTGAFLLTAQREDLLAAGVSRAAAGVIMSLKQGEPSFLASARGKVAMHGEIVTSEHKEIPDLLKQSNESHAYPSRPFIAMSHFLSFEPLIVPVYARCFCLDAVLLSTRHSHHDPASDSHTSRMTTLQEEEEKYKDQVRAQCHPLEALSHLILSL